LTAASFKAKAKSLNKKRRPETFVATSLRETYLRPHRLNTTSPAERMARLSDRVRNIPDRRVGKEFDLGIAGPPGISFVPGLAAIDQFPLEIWERLRAEVIARKGAHLLKSASSRGDADLRKAIAAYLTDFRGARCHADQIVITAGTQ
jgi:GntR family transcriptional regulator / MocR family aminotransferase